MGKDQDFLEAARNGNFAFIEKVLAQKGKRAGPLASLRRGPGVNVQDNSGYSALHHACLNGHIKIVKLLLANDANPNLPDVRGSSPLHLAAWAGEDEIVKMLLTHVYRPANPNLQTIENETPLHCAAQHGHTSALEVLLQNEANPNMCNSRGETPLDLAAQYGRLQAVQMLIRSHPELLAPFSQASIEQRQQISRLSSPLPNSGSISTPSPSSPSFTTVTNSTLSSTSIGLMFPHTCLHLASRNGHKNIVEVLLNAGVYVNLLTPSGTALHEAALCGKENVVRSLLRGGIDLNATDTEGRTALDILQEFPPHVTKHIVSIINNYGHQMDTDDGEDIVVLRNQQSMAPQHYYQSLQHRNNHNNNNSTTNAQYQKHHNNQHYHFNSNNHLLNHSLHSMQQTYNKQPRHFNTVSNNSFNGGKSLDSCLHPEDIANSSSCYSQNSPVLSNSNNSHNEMGISPSSSLSSFEPVSVSPRSRSSTGGIISNNPIHMTTFGPGVPPKKPPRRNLSVSPTHSGQHFSYISPNHQQQPHPTYMSYNSMFRQHRSSSNESPFSQQSHCNVGGMSFDESQIRNRQRNDRLFASARDSSRSISGISMSSSNDMLEQYNEKNESQSISKEKNSTIRQITQAPRHISKEIINCENPTLKSYNPNRKLKRNRNSYSLTLGSVDHSFSSGSTSESKPEFPQSPTNYKQPPTPDHPPPSSSQAEITIHERIRPLSQEYKRRSALLCQQHHIMIDSSTSPAKFMPSQNDHIIYSRSPTIVVSNPSEYKNIERTKGSCASLGSTVSGSEKSGSIENVEEFVSDSLFAGLFKGSRKSFRQVPEKPHSRSADNSNQRQRPLIPEKPTLSEKNKISAARVSKSIEETSLNGDDSQSAKLSTDSDFKPSIRIDKVSPKENNSKEDIEIEQSSKVASDTGSSILSPFNAEEARKKISEIIESFGSGILNSNIANSNDIEIEFDQMYAERQELAVRLRNERLLHLERILFENGYDSFKFMNGVFEDVDLEIIQIPKEDHSKLLNFVNTLPPAEFLPRIPIIKTGENYTENLENGVGTVNQWLCSLGFEEYLENFRKHLYNNLESVYGMWDVELQTVLEINKVGHRRRILRSLDFMRQIKEPKFSKSPLEENNDNNKPVSNAPNNKDHRVSIGVYRKNRPAPQPPSCKENTLQIRAPAELLLDLPANLRTKWRYSANVLLKEKIKYDVYYLGSTVVKELRGTESTLKSIKKLKRDDSISNNIDSPKRAMLSLAISHSGVEFIDASSKRTICEHEIQNINCACQEADDIRYFAYITKEQNLHYCHVFHVDSADLATDIILTLGQAFEVAYQLAIRDGAAAVTTTIAGN